jgi:hypothetical protein
MPLVARGQLVCIEMLIFMGLLIFQTCAELAPGQKQGKTAAESYGE